MRGTSHDSAIQAWSAELASERAAVVEARAEALRANQNARALSIEVKEGKLAALVSFLVSPISIQHKHSHENIIGEIV